MQTIYMNWGHKRSEPIGLPKFPAKTAATNLKANMTRRNKTAPKPTLPKLKFTERT